MKAVILNPTSPFGVIQAHNGVVTSFKEKSVLDDLINGGDMVLSRKVFDYIPAEDCAFEREPLHRLAENSQLAVYRHTGIWTAIDTCKDVERVNAIWNAGDAPWKIWN